MGKQVLCLNRLVWQIVQHHIKHFTVESPTVWNEGKKSGKNTQWKWEHLDPLQGPKMPTEPTPNTLHGGAQPVLSRNSMEAYSPSLLQHAGSPLFTATLQQRSLHGKQRELGPLAPLCEGAQSPTSWRKGPAMGQPPSADTRSQRCPSDTTPVVLAGLHLKCLTGIRCQYRNVY